MSLFLFILRQALLPPYLSFACQCLRYMGVQFTEYIVSSCCLVKARGLMVYYIEKHVIRLGFQSVLNRKACYTPRFPMCIKSKSMLYA